ncbi:hypothetical protein BGZ47_010110 [Haplosporangium gracile]|nr:hypothetical protein BGZ47_010110 [Haplosporangium gracile]
METQVSEDLHVALVPEVTVEFAVFTDRGAHGEPPLSPSLLNTQPYSSSSITPIDNYDDYNDNQPRSMYFEEKFAYPTNLTSGPMIPDEEDEDYYYNQDQRVNSSNSQGKDSRVDRLGKSTTTAAATSGRSIEIIGGGNEEQKDERSRATGGGIGEGEGGHYSQCHPSRNINTSTGSDLIQVTVEDLLISKEQSRTIKASIDLARQESSRPSVLPIATANAVITTTPTGTAVSPTTKTVAGSSPSPPLSPVPNVTTTTITATIRTIGGRGTSFLFDGDTDTDATKSDDTSNASVAQLLLASKKSSAPQSQSSLPPLSAPSERSSQSQLPSANNTSPTTTAATGAAETAQGQGQQGVSKKRGVSQPPTATPKLQKPVIPLTPAQQREAEADDNIQRAIELHERNQLEEATHYFRLAAQSENPLGQLMYGLSLRHGWGCKANPKEAIVYLQRAAEYAMGEMKVIDGAPTTTSSTVSVVSAPVDYSNAANNNSSPDMIGSQPLSPPLSPSSLSPLSTSTERTQPSQSAAAAGAPPLQSVRRMGSMDRTTAMSMARRELVMALYELGMSYLKGWGVAKDKPVAFTYFKIAADLGDPDSQNETALCYYEGIGIEKDMYESAKYYRMASAQGASQLGNSWIWKPKYDQYCAAENAAVSAAATIGSISVVTNATSRGTKKGSSKERAKRLTSAIQTAIATSAVAPASSNSTPAGSSPSSPSSVRSHTKFPGSWITQNNNSSSITSLNSSSSPTSPSAPSIPSPQYTLTSIASGLASVTAATTGVVVPPVYGTSSVNNSTTNITSPPTSPTSPRPSIASSIAPTTPTSISSPASTEALEKKKRRWTLWSGQRTPPSSSSVSVVAVP